MSFRSLDAGAASLLYSVFAEPGPAVYHSLTDGDYSVEVILDLDVEVMDEGGFYTRVPMITMRSGVVEKPRSGDEIALASGDRWQVERLESDDGTEIRLLVRAQ